MEVVYEDNHVIVVNKSPGEIVQGDKTGDEPLSEKVKAYIKEVYAKPGSVFLGVVHRLDRPVGGLVVFARTSKSLSRLNQMFRDGKVKKTYWAIVGKNGKPNINGTADDDGFVRLEHWMIRNEKQNKSYAYDHEKPGSKHAILDYRVIGVSDRYMLVEVRLHTGRHHQIRCQLSKVGLPIKGDLKYGAPRSNPDGSISLIARSIEFVHPVSQKVIQLTAPLPDDRLWQTLGKNVD